MSRKIRLIIRFRLSISWVSCVVVLEVVFIVGVVVFVVFLVVYSGVFSEVSVGRKLMNR